MDKEKVDLICKKFFEKYTTQFELAAGDDDYIYFCHTIMDKSVRVSLDDTGELKVEEI